MREVWLRGNSRIQWLAIGCAAILCALGLGLSWYAWRNEQAVLAGFAALLAALPWIVLAWLRRQHATRLEYEPGRLRVRVGAQNEAIPIESVECFLLGQSASFLPGDKHRRTETRTLVVRLRENAAEWEHRELDPRLATWCGHHITIRGTWCEPLSIALAQRLNDRLVAVQRARREAS